MNQPICGTSLLREDSGESIRGIAAGYFFCRITWARPLKVRMLTVLAAESGTMVFVAASSEVVLSEVVLSEIPEGQDADTPVTTGLSMCWNAGSPLPHPRMR